MIERNINLIKILKQKSVLLLGPRGTGKSYYIRNQLKEMHVINLLKSSDFLSLSENPSKLEEMIEPFKNKLIVIDEIQKVPALLDEVHRLIEEKGVRFLLTGSSARKLKADSVNLLAGRAWPARMFPFNYLELNSPRLKKILTYGTLPAIYLSDSPLEELDAYITTYIEAELKAEGIIRKIPAFSRFLKAAALSNGELLNYHNISSDTGVPESTLKEHYHILEDTMIGFQLSPWKESKKRKAIATGKFYFFDLGVLNYLSSTFPESETSPIWGNRFETFIINEVRCALSYLRRKDPVYYWRSTSDFEVDLIFGNCAVEIKATKKVQEKHLLGIKALQEENKFKKYFLVSQDPTERIHHEIHIIPFQKFLEMIWKGEV